jgi:nucleoid-associated protein YgaU
MYDIFINNIMYPVVPDNIKMKIGNNNKTIHVINEGTISIPKKAGLTEISFVLLLPNVRYPFARYEEGFHKAEYYLKKLEKLKVKKKNFQFIVSREMPNGKKLFATNITCTLEDYTIEEDVDEGFDVKVSVKLKQYVGWKTQTCKIKKTKKKKKKKVSTSSRSNTKKTPSKTKTYTVVKGDTLWGIASKFYGEGSKYKVIYNASQNVFKGRSANILYPGEVLTIPPDS